jgi:PAS domain S-box-containing protein
MMGKEETKTKEIKKLRRKAKEQLKKKIDKLRKQSAGDPEQVLHELQVHQIELDMQNEQLRQAQQQLEESRDRYTDLYDFAPAGYFTLDKNGLIIEANLTGCQMLGIERKNLVKKPFRIFVDKASQDQFYLHRRDVLNTEAKKSCEITLIRRDKTTFEAQLESVPTPGKNGKMNLCRTIITDITERKTAEEQIQNIAKFPEENPFPVLRLSKDGEILYSNMPGKVILEQWNCEIGQKAPQDWRQLALRALKSENYLVKEIDCGNKIYSCAIAPIPAGGYVNLYGRDVTKQRDVILSLQKSEQKFRLFSETAGQLLQSKNPLGLAETLCRKVMEYLDCHAFFHYLVDDEKQCLHLNAYAGISKTAAGKIERLDYGTTICGCVARDAKHIVVENIPETQDPRADMVRPLGIKAYACYPLTSHGRVIGTLSFGTCTRTMFSKEDLDVMRTVTDQVATAMARVNAEETIRKSEEHIRSQLAEIESIYNTAVVGLCVLDRHLRYVRVNQHIAEMNSLSIDEHIGKTIREVAPKLANTMEKVARKVFRTGESALDIEISGTTAADPMLLHYWKQQWLPIKDDAGKVTAINVVTEDITEIKRIEKYLVEINYTLGKKVQTQSQELSRTAGALQQEVAERVRAETDLKERTRILNAFFAHTVTPLVILDRKFNFVRVNQAYADACQRDISEFYGHNHFEFYANEENEEIFKKVVRTKKPYQTFAKPFIYPDHPEWGTTYWDWTLSPIIGENGRVESLVFSLMDVTKRKLAEIALQDSEEKYRSLIEFSPEGVCVLVEEKIAFANTAAVKLLKAKKPQDVVGRSMWDFIRPDSAQMARSDLKEILEQHHKISSKEIKLSCLDGSPIEVETSATSVLHQGKPGALVLFHDITERKSAQARMNVTNSLLELFAEKTSRQEYLDSVVEIIRNWSGCRCVGIRLTNADGLIPYESYTGFSEEFLSLENRLCLKTDFCICIRAILQTSVPQDTPLLTAKGSFRTNNSLEFIKSLSVNEKKQYRGNCIQFGFASLAVIPIRYRDKILGAIHLADEGRNKAPLETVEFLDDMAAMIGEAVHRFNVEQSLRLNEKRLTEAQKLAHLGNWEWDIPANRLWWSDEVYRIFGLEPSLFGITYDAFVSCIHPDDRKFVEELINKSLHQGKEYNINFRIIRPDETERIILVKAEVTYEANHNPIKMTGTVYDITEQKQAENEIREHQQSLRVLAAELQLAEERERRRIAQDLHDSIGQILAFSGRELKSLQKSLPEQTAKTIEEITNQLDTAVEQSRTLSFDLSPSTLYDLGFEVAVEDLVDRTAKTRNIPCYFENYPSDKPLTDDVKVLLYRSVRELLINAVKHANPGYIKVSLSRKNSDICIQVEDDGRGFNASILESSSTKSKGFGIFSIRERLSHIGGRLEIESAEGKGTKAILIAPLDIEREQQEVSL